MSRLRDEHDEASLVHVLKSQPYGEPGPARLKFEQRRFMACLAQDSSLPKAPVSTEANVRRRWTYVAATATAMAACAILAVALGFFEQTPEPVSLAGSWIMETGDIISQGTRIRVPKDTEAKLVLPDGTVLWLAPSAEISMEDQTGNSVRVHSGRILAKVTPHTAPDFFRVLIPQGVVTVHGTVFSVSTNKDSSTVRLHEGKISLSSQGKSIEVQPGHQVEVSQNGFKEMRAFGIAERTADLEISSEPIALEHEKTSLALSEPLNQDQLPTMETATSQEMEIAAIDSKTEPPQRARQAGLKLSRIKKLYREKQYETIVKLTKGQGHSPDLLYYRGRAMEGLRQWSDAADVYISVAQVATGRRSESAYLAAKALFKAGKMEGTLKYSDVAINAGGPTTDQARFLRIRALTKLHRYGDCAKASREYIKVHPKGAHFEDAMYLWGYSLAKAGEMNQSRTALEKYLSIFPEGRYADQVRKVLGQ